MPARTKTTYRCADCGAQSAQWHGQCDQCGAWNSINPETPAAAITNQPAKAHLLADIKISDTPRIASGSAELDRVFGGGLVPASLVLLGGAPGIGKSTLVLQALAHLSQSAKVLYASGEESAEQIAMRAQRLGLTAANVQVLAEPSLEALLASVTAMRPKVLVVDSIQTCYSSALGGPPGSVSQVREATARLSEIARQLGCVVWLVGHITKEGTLAGPRVLEHMVDCVLTFEGDDAHSFRLLRASKNRFGAVNEVGVFAMSEHGLVDVANPSAMLVSRLGGRRPGSVVFASQQGSRPLLVEVQALVDPSAAEQPRRLSIGLPAQRLHMLLAVCHRHLGINFAKHDVFTSAVGGVRVLETGGDLPLALAMLSSLREQTLGENMAVFGELGLAGELRPVQRGQERLREAQKLGFERVLLPAANCPKQKSSDLELIPMREISELKQLFGL